jgi:hypothetical protein
MENQEHAMAPMVLLSTDQYHTSQPDFKVDQKTTEIM